jgi:hypothetical protein
LDNVGATESNLQKGVHERVLHFRTGKTPLENGKFKLWVFSKLYRELLEGGMASTDDINTLIQMGAGFGMIEGWEKFPPK